MKRQQENFFSRNLRFLMERLGVTQEELAADLGVSQTTISKYLKGRIPRAETLVFLAGYFPNVQVSTLLSSDLSHSPNFKATPKRPARPMVARLNGFLAALPDSRAESMAQALFKVLHAMESAHSNPTHKDFPLTNVPESGKHADVKAQLPSLLERVKHVTTARGSKSALAKYMGVPLSNVSQWLSGSREPGGETTLRLLRWVEQQEAK
jgi:transcriptional regulator with XRE-family HTH domain